MEKANVKAGLLVKNIKGSGMELGVVLEHEGDNVTVRFSRSGNDFIKEVKADDLMVHNVTEQFLTDVITLNA